MWNETVGSWWHHAQVDSVISKYPGCLDKDPLLSLLPESVDNRLNKIQPGELCLIPDGCHLSVFSFLYYGLLANFLLTSEFYMAETWFFKYVFLPSRCLLLMKKQHHSNRWGSPEVKLSSLEEGGDFHPECMELSSLKHLDVGSGAVSGLGGIWSGSWGSAGWMSHVDPWPLSQSLLSTVFAWAHASCCPLSKGMSK